MVEAEDRNPFSHNPTGLVPQFRGVPVSISEIGFTPGKDAAGVRAFDNVESRKGYSGPYQVGASYNHSKFTTASGATQSGNYLLYWMGSQALWRVDPKGEGTRWNGCVRLEPLEPKRQQHDVQRGTAVQRTAPAADPQHDVPRLRTEPLESRICGAC
jgi:porin